SARVPRAHLIRLDEGQSGPRLPPPSGVPTPRELTMSPPLPQALVGFPNIPGVTYTGLKTTRYLLDYGPHYYETGIASIDPPVITPPYQDNPANGPIYPSYVPRTDRDGNDIPPVRPPPLTAPPP